MADELFLAAKREGERLISEAINGHLSTLYHGGSETPHMDITKIVNNAICQTGLKLCEGNKSNLAAMLGINRGTLGKRIKAMKEHNNGR